jgi:hypothetical protein
MHGGAGRVERALLPAPFDFDLACKDRIQIMIKNGEQNARSTQANANHS